MPDGDGGNLPLAILLAGAGAVAAFMAMRPWPQAAGKPIKPGAYVVDVLRAQPPPAGPQQFSPTEVHLTEVGLASLLGIWAAGKAGSALSGIGSAASSATGVIGKIWGWIKGLGKSGEEGLPAEVP